MYSEPEKRGPGKEFPGSAIRPLVVPDVLGTIRLTQWIDGRSWRKAILIAIIFVLASILVNGVFWGSGSF